MSTIIMYILAGFATFGFIYAALKLRQVVETNQVHIVQSAKNTTSYGKDSPNGNVYWAFPSWLPFVGVKVIILPVSNFDLSLNGYAAYDQDRVPFKVDVTAFFRIDNTNLAAQRVSNIGELNDQLEAIVQGAVRTILAGHTIDQIMMERDTFGVSFTNAVTPELEGWGVVPVKNLELMDIRDAEDSKVIFNIMAKKKSFIEMESRKEVAENERNAREAEIEAQRQVDLSEVEAERQVGERTAEKDKTVGIANEKSQQEIKVEAAITAEKDMAVKKVQVLREAEIDRDNAEIEKDEAAFQAEAKKKLGYAEAEVREKIFKADNALEIRLNIQRDTAIGVAKALADTNLVPRVFIGGNDGEQGPASATDTLAKFMTLNLGGQLLDLDGDEVKDKSNLPFMDEKDQ